MISLRLPQTLEAQLNREAKLQQLSKSQVVKTALEKYFGSDKTEKTPYELGKHVFGKYSLGRSDLSVNFKKILKQKINEKYHH